MQACMLLNKIMKIGAHGLVVRTTFRKGYLAWLMNFAHLPENRTMNAEKFLYLKKISP